MTRNGESASINVGQEVPTVTSQGVTTSSGVLTGTTNVVPQTIQYRKPACCCACGPSFTRVTASTSK
jgi:Bacterial type II and III secretion system protein.